MHTLIGNAHAKQLLQNMVESEKIPSTLLFSGPKGVGKTLFAKAFAQQIMGGDFPVDIRFLNPEMYTIESIRELIQDASRRPFQSRHYKVWILDDVEQMLPASANALLKILEEPPAYCIFILISSTPELLLDTISSRCRHVPFLPVPDFQQAKNTELLENFLKPQPYHERLKAAIALEEHVETQDSDTLWHQVLARYAQHPALPHLIKTVEKLRFATEQHVKLRTCLEILALTLEDV